MTTDVGAMPIGVEQASRLAQRLRLPMGAILGPRWVMYCYPCSLPLEQGYPCRHYSPLEPQEPTRLGVCLGLVCCHDVCRGRLRCPRYLRCLDVARYCPRLVRLVPGYRGQVEGIGDGNPDNHEYINIHGRILGRLIVGTNMSEL